MVALDGERELLVRPGEETRVRMSSDGPLVVQVEKTLALAAERGMFTNTVPGAVDKRAARVNGRRTR